VMPCSVRHRACPKKIESVDSAVPAKINGVVVGKLLAIDEPAIDIGRYLSQDPVGLLGRTHPYEYAPIRSCKSTRWGCWGSPGRSDTEDDLAQSN
jgi:hypothetical protein